MDNIQLSKHTKHANSASHYITAALINLASFNVHALNGLKMVVNIRYVNGFTAVGTKGPSGDLFWFKLKPLAL